MAAIPPNDKNRVRQDILALAAIRLPGKHSGRAYRFLKYLLDREAASGRDADFKESSIAGALYPGSEEMEGSIRKTAMDVRAFLRGFNDHRGAGEVIVRIPDRGDPRRSGYRPIFERKPRTYNVELSPQAIARVEWIAPDEDTVCWFSVKMEIGRSLLASI